VPGAPARRRRRGLRRRRCPDYETLKRLEYAGACLKEALRIYNIVPIVTRKALADDHFGEYRCRPAAW
jgi:cytochrome P450